MWQRLQQSSDWRFVAIFIAFMTLLQAIGPEYFRYRQDLVEQGQLWRYFSAHWVHVGWMHLLLNASGLVICVILTHPGWSASRWLLCIVILGTVISLMLVLNKPEVRDYAGFRGCCSGCTRCVRSACTGAIA